MTSMYPVTLNLKGKFCTVVGGGQVAVRKVKSLLAQGAEVTVISPALHEELQALEGQFVWMNSPYKEGQLEGSFLVIAATDDRAVNHQIALWCEENQMLVNVVDSLQESSFTVNSAVQRGDLQLTVSTNGVSPAISKKIRLQLEEQFGPEYATALEIVAEARREAMKTIADEGKRREFLQSLADLELAQLLQQESRDDVEKRVRACLSSYWD